MNKIEQKYQQLKDTPSDINEHLPTLKKYTEQCDHVTEMGVRAIVSTWALLAGNPKRMVSIDIKHPKNFGGNLDEVIQAANGTTRYEFKLEDTTKNDIEETDLLFIDTVGYYEQLKSELRHAGRVRKYIILHDTQIFAVKGEDGGEGLMKAVEEFLLENKEWEIKEQFTNNNGLMVLGRTGVAIPEVIVEQKPEPVPPPAKKKLWNKVKFIIPFPNVPYYEWQVLVQINNLAKFGYDVDAHYLVCTLANNPGERLTKIASSPKINATFHFYKDERDDEGMRYAASMKPWLMYKYFEQHPWEKNVAYAYLDPDVIFLDKFDFEPYLYDDVWYGSDVRSYINSSYIQSKGEGLFEEMCAFINIDPNLVKQNDKNCVGAQYLTKNNTPQFWKNVYEKSSRLYNHLERRKTWYFKPEMTYWFQNWSNEMFITLWELWSNKVETKFDPNWEFHWANHLMKDKKHKLFHNAGVAGKTDELHFCKIAYQSSPFKKDIPTKEESLSYLYMREVKETEKNYPELIW